MKEYLDPIILSLEASILETALRGLEKSDATQSVKKDSKPEDLRAVVTANLRFNRASAKITRTSHIASQLAISRAASEL